MWCNDEKLRCSWKPAGSSLALHYHGNHQLGKSSHHSQLHSAFKALCSRFLCLLWPLPNTPYLYIVSRILIISYTYKTVDYALTSLFIWTVSDPWNCLLFRLSSGLESTSDSFSTHTVWARKHMPDVIPRPKSGIFGQHVPHEPCRPRWHLRGTFWWQGVKLAWSFSFGRLDLKKQEKQGLISFASQLLWTASYVMWKFHHESTLLGTITYPIPAGIFKGWFLLFPMWDRSVPWRGNLSTQKGLLGQ